MKPSNVELVKKMTIVNASHVFLAGAVIGDIKEARNVGMVNSYLGDIEYEGNIHNPVFVLFKPPDLGRFRLFCEGEKKHGRKWKDDYDYPGHIIMVYSFPLDGDYQLFLEGKYSEMSKEYRKLLPKLELIRLNVPEYKGVAEYKEDPWVWAILNKNPAVRKDWIDVLGELPGNGEELFPKPQMDKEIFDYSEYVKTMPKG